MKIQTTCIVKENYWGANAFDDLFDKVQADHKKDCNSQLTWMRSSVVVQFVKKDFPRSPNMVNMTLIPIIVFVPYHKGVVQPDFLYRAYPTDRPETVRRELQMLVKELTKM